MFTRKSVTEAIGNANLELVQGNGYLYFVYEDNAVNVYESESIMVCRLNHMSKEQWIETGKDFLAKVATQHNIVM